MASLADQAYRLRGALSCWAAEEGAQRAAIKRRGSERERDQCDTNSSDMQELGREAARIDEIYEDERTRLYEWNQSRLDEGFSGACGSSEIPGSRIERCICTRGKARCTNWRSSRDAAFGWTCSDCASTAATAGGCRFCGCRGCALLGSNDEDDDLQAAAYLQALEWEADVERGDPPSDYEFQSEEEEDPDLTDWGAAYRRHHAASLAAREAMIESNQTELIAKAEEVLRGLEKEEEEAEMQEAADAAANTELQEVVAEWEATAAAANEREERELAEVAAILNQMEEENVMASVALSSMTAPRGAGALSSPPGAAKHPWA